MAEPEPELPSSDDDADEFFETADEIPSTSASSDSEGEQQRHRFKARLRDPAPFPFFDSKYAVWRSDPATIGERRLRLFQKLGIDDLLKPPAQQPTISTCRSFPPAAPSPRVVRSISDPIPDKPRCPSPPENVGKSHPPKPSPPPAVSRQLLHEEDEDEERRRSSSGSSGRDFVCRIKDLDSGREFVVHELGSDGLWTKVREVGTGREMSLEELGILKDVRKVENTSAKDADKNGRRRTAKGGGWFRGIRGAMRRSNSEGDGGGGKLDKSPSENSVAESTRRPPSWKMQRIKVRVSKKVAGELAELYMGQEIRGHQGPIWALRFSSGGRYLASGGQDCVVRVWKVVLLENQIAAGGTHGENPSSKYRKKRGSSNKKLNDDKFRLSTFGLESEPVCNLRGHTEDILDLSWSSSKLLLLSSSMDKTVRLWDVEHQDCLQIFPHSDYVTCIKFNPADDSCFLSGSLDGKVRIWSILEHHVIDWTDLREIVTAASYTPDGTGAMIGSSKGACRFYKTAGNKLQFDGLIEVVSKKGKSFRGKKISGIQCMPGNPSKILVTSNDSQVRLYDGTDLIAKFKGFRNMSSQISASFSGNGSLIISASEDSHVYLWNVSPPSSTCRGQLKMSEKSSESFFSDNVTAAVPWADNRGKRPSDDRGAALNKLGSDLLQLLRQSSFPGPCFECLTSTVFPVTDEATTNCGGAPAISSSSSSCSSSSGSSNTVGLDSAPSSDVSGSKSSAVTAAVAAESEPAVCFTDEPLELPAGGLGLVIVTASLSGEIRTFQNYVVKEAA